ncbi:hypothetical protein LZ554_006292 [Drepanopeziza brunnea f. sp. 'monogermtubi']|nr:hypothetical protein LZ554_006292 [Drepanopeziza brunnea f. sp. 'monogermtubi']
MKSLSVIFCSLLALKVSAAPYIVTSYVVLSVYTREGYTQSDRTRAYTTYSGTTYAESLATYTYPANVPTTTYSALSTVTTSAEYAGVTVVEILLQSAPRYTRSYASYDSESLYLETQYVVPITYSPDATCSQNWTLTSMVPVYVPAIVTPTIASLSTSVSTYSYEHLNPTMYTEVLAILNPSDIASSDVASASATYAPESYYMSNCYTPTTKCYTSPTALCRQTWSYDSSSSRSSRSFYDSDDDYNYWTPLILLCVLVPVGWFLIWFLVGLLESWVSFKGLMLGKHRKRGLPYAWCCISWLFLCWVGPTYKAKSPEEQAVLLERWKEMKKREKFKLWMKHGFRWKYPDILGAEPELAKRAFRQGCL